MRTQLHFWIWLLNILTLFRFSSYFVVERVPSCNIQLKVVIVIPNYNIRLNITIQAHTHHRHYQLKTLTNRKMDKGWRIYQKVNCWIEFHHFLVVSHAIVVSFHVSFVATVTTKTEKKMWKCCKICMDMRYLTVIFFPILPFHQTIVVQSFFRVWEKESFDYRMQLSLMKYNIFLSFLSIVLLMILICLLFLK